MDVSIAVDGGIGAERWRRMKDIVLRRGNLSFLYSHRVNRLLATTIMFSI